MMQNPIFILKLVVCSFIFFLLVQAAARYYEYRRTGGTWLQWSKYLEPFEPILKEAGCDFVEKAKNKKFFSKRDEFSPISFPLPPVSYTSTKTSFENQKNKITIYYYYGINRSLFEWILNLGNVKCLIQEVHFYFKTQDRFKLMITYNGKIAYDVIELSHEIGSNTRFLTAEKALEFIENKLLLELFS